MTETLLGETFLYGSLKVAYTTREIKKFPVQNLSSYLGSLSWEEEGIGTMWRFYSNFRTLFRDREVDILNDLDRYRDIINLFKDYTSIVEETFDIRDKFINLTPETVSDHFKITVYALLTEIYMIIKPYELKSLNEMYGNLFSSYLPFIKNQNIICYFRNPPHGDTSWVPMWKFIYGTKEIHLLNIDCYIDTYFTNSHFQYNYEMKDNLKYLNERLLYIRKNSPTYMKMVIEPKLEDVTRNIFDIFPYQIIYQSYPPLMDFETTYQPPLYKSIKINEGIGWVLSILPLHLTAFLIGYPVITCSIPSIGNISDNVKEISEKGFDHYLEKVRKNNRCLFESYSFGIPIRNGTDDDGDFCDHFYEKIIDYNFDDTLIFYNTGVIHVFTSSEFKNILKQKISSYNRNKIPILSKVNSSEHFKKDVKRAMGMRGLAPSLKQTMKTNLEEIEEQMKSGEIKQVEEEPRHRFDVPQRSLFSIILNDDDRSF